MSIVSVDNIQPIGSGTSVTVNNAATLVVGNLNSSGVVTATSFSGDGSQLTGTTGTTINTNADNRLITGSGTANTLNGEANLTFNGSQLTVSGIVTATNVSASSSVTAATFHGSGASLTAINTPSFSAYVTGNPEIDGNTATIVVFNAEDHDTDSAYNTSTGIFTVPSGKAGKYHIDAYGGIDDINDEGYIRIFVLKNDSYLPGFRGQSHSSADNRVETTGVSGTATLAVGDEIKVQLFTNTAGTHQIENQACVFSMFRLSI